jgi:hypothetical protein
MNYWRLGLAAVAATIVYFALGGIAFAVLPLGQEYANHPAIFRSQESIMSVFPVGMIGMPLAMAALIAIYAKLQRSGAGAVEGAKFGGLIGVFAIGAFVLHNYVNLNIGAKLVIEQAGMYFVEWVAAGVVIGLIYKS